MARRFDRNNSAEKPKLRNVMDNPRNENIAKDILDILQAAHPDKQWEDILTAEENAINEWAWTWLLQELNKRNALDFWFFWHENFSLEELWLLNLNKIPWLDESDDIRAGIENAIVRSIKYEFSHGLDNEIARKFNDTVKYHNTTLSELLATINLFENQLNWEDKWKYLKFRNNFVLTFLQIKNNLAPINDASNNNINENLNTKSFSDWTESQQKWFDYLFSKLILSRLHSRVEWISTMAEDITNSFSLPLSMSVIPQSQEYSIGENGYESLKEYAKDNFPELYEELQNATEENLEEIYWKIYLNKIEQTDPAMAEALWVLYENNFDVACLNNEPAKRDAFISKLAELRLKGMEESWAIEAFGNDTEQFKRFFLDLFDFSKNEVTVNWMTLHIDKELKWGIVNPDLKNLSDFMNAKDLPIKFSVKWVDSLNLSMDDQQLFNKLFQWDFVDVTETNPDWTPWTVHKDLVLEDSKIWKFLIFYLMWNPSVIESYNPESEQGKKLNNFFRSLDRDIAIDKSKRELSEDEKRHNEDWENSEDEEENREEWESIKEKILGLWNGLKGDEVREGEESFKEWAILYYPFWDSVLPPKGDSSKDWMKLYIKDVDWNRWMIKMRSNGVELELPWGWENKDIEMPLTVFSKRFLEGTPDVWGAPFKQLTRKTNFEETFESFSKQGLCKDSILWDASFEDWKLMLRTRWMDWKEHNEEVKYFSSWLNVPDDSKVVYGVNWNSDGTVAVKSSSFASDRKPYEYKRKMSYPDFLVFLSEKQLSPRTERMAEDEKVRIKDVVSHTTTKIKWMTIWWLIYSFKNIWKTLNDWIDNYQKKQNQECLDWLVSKWIYDKIWKWFWWASPSLAEAAMQAQDKAEKWMDKATWEGIDTWLKEFSSLADFANFFEKWVDAPSWQKFRELNKILKANGFKTLKEVVSSWTFVWENDKLRPIIAAAMIANIKKWAWLYRWLANQDNQCLWIRCLLWPAHYRRYLEMRRKLENDIKQAELNKDSGKVKQLSDLLVQSETTYIINCIENSHGKDEYFWAPSDNNTQALKLLYSNEFASQLGSAVDEGIGEAAVDKGYSWTKKYNLFDPVFKEVEKNITSWRIDRWLWNIERLWEVAVNDSDFVNLNVAMTYVTLTWILNRKEGKNIRTRFDGLARAYMLPTAFFWEKNENQRNAWYILEKSWCWFSEFMASKWLSMEQFMSTSDDVPYKQLFWALKEWWFKNSKQIDTYFESLKINEQKDPILKKVRDILWETNPDSISPKWRSKPKITWHYALLASPESIRQNKGYDRDWFSWDTDERNDKAAFWESLLKSLKRAPEDVDPKFFLKEFKLLFNYEGFWTGNDAENNMMIKMIKDVKERAWESLVFHVPQWWGMIDIPSRFVYSKDDYKHLIWYMFKWRVLYNNWRSAPPKQVDDVLNFFVNYFTRNFDRIAWDDALLNEVFPMAEKLPERRLVPWWEYQDNIQWDNNYFDLGSDSDEADIDSKDLEKQRKAMRNRKKKYYRRSDLFYNDELLQLQKGLKRIGVSAKSLAELGWERWVEIN